MRSRIFLLALPLLLLACAKKEPAPAMTELTSAVLDASVVAGSEHGSAGGLTAPGDAKPDAGAMSGSERGSAGGR